jgi:RNA 2',3'-cyclic 3'-phosphodiesterase
MIRTFLAVELGEPLRANLSTLQQDLKQRLLRGASREVRISWVPPASIHLTLKFLGDIDEQLVLPMREAIGEAVRDHQPVHIPFERLGVFPRLQQPRVLWAGPTAKWEQGDDAARLAALHRTVEECCRSFDIAPEGRPLSPHLTLARIREGERSMGQALTRSGVMDRPLSLGSLSVESIVLMKSELRPTGPVYTGLWTSRLAAGV